MIVKASESRVESFRPPGDTGRIVASRGESPRDVIAAILTLVVSTVVMFLVALHRGGELRVIAQRRLPQLGMMAAVGATEQHLRLVMLATGAATGSSPAVLGGSRRAGRLGRARPRWRAPSGFRVDPFNVPWWLSSSASSSRS